VDNKIKVDGEVYNSLYFVLQNITKHIDIAQSRRQGIIKTLPNCRFGVGLNLNIKIILTMSVFM
jgi:hypothetical protein